MASVGAMCSVHELRNPPSPPLGAQLTSIADLNSCTGSGEMHLRLIDLGATFSWQFVNNRN